jgi:ABC-2 type transport system permease protein
MIADIMAVIWKERKTLFRQQGSRARTAFTFLVPIAVFGIYLPWGEGRGWVEGYWSLATSVFIPLVMVSTIIAESVAGERERHTLETLLASRLPDRAILFGKLGFAIGYGWFVNLAMLFVGLIVANIAGWDGQVVFFTPIIAIGNLVISLLIAGIVTSLGVFISLRASTAQAAIQTLMAATLFPLLIIGIILTALVSKKGNFAQGIADFMGKFTPTQIILIFMAVLLIVCAALIWAVMNRFRRQRLILN